MKRFQLLPFALLAAAVLAALTVMRSSSSSSASGPVQSAEPPPGRDLAVPPSASSGPALAPLSEMEQRDVRIRINNVQCEDAVKHYNVVFGREPTDKKGLHLVGLCLSHGNVAWNKCINVATTPDEALTCNRRLLMP